MSPVFALIDNPVMLLVLGALAVLLFGERLPEVARSFGKGLMELRKGVHGIQRELENAVNTATTVDATRDTAPSPYQPAEDRQEPTGPKFEPPPAP
jgi:sec-independent protein translocase protein TatA